MRNQTYQPLLSTPGSIALRSPAPWPDLITRAGDNGISRDISPLSSAFPGSLVRAVRARAYFSLNQRILHRAYGPSFGGNESIKILLQNLRSSKSNYLQIRRGEYLLYHLHVVAIL